jgi:integrase
MTSNSRQAAYRRAAQKPAPWMIESRFDQTPGYVPSGAEGPATPQREPSVKPKTIVAKLDLTDPRVEARIEMNDAGNVIMLHDFGGKQSVPGLRLRIGPRTATWLFYRDVLDHGERKITSKTLGKFPEMDTATARNRASIVSGRLAGGKFEPSKSAARKFGDEFEKYIAYLKEQAEDKGKVAYTEGKFAGHSRWSRNVLALGNLILLPKWKTWSLADMSDRRGDDDEMGLWYRDTLKRHGATQTNHAMRIIRAVYRRAAKNDKTNTLSGDPTKLPTAAVKLRRENWQRKGGKDKPGIAFDKFPAWLVAWRELEPPIHRWYHLLGLLTGARPGELLRSPRANVDLKSYTLVIGNAKSGHDITVTLSPQIERALEKARKAHPNSDLLFPDCSETDRDPLPARGMALRRTWKTIATDCGVTDDQSALLLGHAIPGVSAGYMLRQVLTQGPLLRELQAKISARIADLLGTDPTL